MEREDERGGANMSEQMSDVEVRNRTQWSGGVWFKRRMSAGSKWCVSDVMHNQMQTNEKMGHMRRESTQ